MQSWYPITGAASKQAVSGPAQPAPAAPRWVGMATQISTSGNDSNRLDLVSSANANIIREDVFWSQVETTAGVYNFSNYGYIDQAYNQFGLRTLPIGDYGNSLYTSVTSTTDPSGRNAYANYAAAVCSHFGTTKCPIFEIWNEWDGWCGTTAACISAYADLIKRTYPVIKAASPNTLVIAGSGGGEYPLTAGNYYNDLMDQGIGPYIDGFAFHSYDASQFRGYSGVSNFNAQFSANHEHQYMIDLHSMVSSKAGRDITIYMTEEGLSTCTGCWTETMQADYVTALFNTLNDLSFLKMYIWYSWIDCGTDPSSFNCTQGLIHRDAPTYTKKPSWTSFKNNALTLIGP